MIAMVVYSWEFLAYFYVEVLVSSYGLLDMVSTSFPP